MSVRYDAMAAVTASIIVITTVYAMGWQLEHTEPALIVLATSIIVGLLWNYSPLPDHNGGFDAPEDRGRYWGLKRGEQ